VESDLEDVDVEVLVLLKDLALREDLVLTPLEAVLESLSLPSGDSDEEEGSLGGS